MGLSLWHILIVLLVVLIVFGAGKLPQIMGDLGKGIKSFKSGLDDSNQKSVTSNQKLEDKSQKSDS